jgi:hypothetical protein
VDEPNASFDGGQRGLEGEGEIPRKDSRLGAGQGCRPTPRAVLRHDPATIRCKIQCRSCRDCDTMAAAVENGLTLALQVYRGESESDTARVEWTTAVCSGEQYSHWYRLPLCPWDEAGSGSHRSAIH